MVNKLQEFENFAGVLHCLAYSVGEDGASVPLTAKLLEDFFDLGVLVAVVVEFGNVLYD